MTNNIYFLPVLLQIIGIVIVFAEVIIPSGGILSIISITLFGYSLYFVFNSISMAAGIGFIIADLLIIPVVVVVGFKYLAKSPATLKKELSSENGVTSQSLDLINFEGKEGIVLSDLRPSGAAEIDNKRVDVVSRGEYILKSSKIIVHKVTGNQIIVKKL